MRKFRHVKFGGKIADAAQTSFDVAEYSFLRFFTLLNDLCVWKVENVVQQVADAFLTRLDTFEWRANETVEEMKIKKE